MKIALLIVRVLLTMTAGALISAGIAHVAPNAMQITRVTCAAVLLAAAEILREPSKSVQKTLPPKTRPGA